MFIGLLRKLVLPSAGFFVLGALLLSLSCGGDDDDDKPAEEEPTTLKTGQLACGKEACTLPEGLTGVYLCCADAFAGTCGITTKKRDDCRPFPKPDNRCPVPKGTPFDDPQFGFELASTVVGCCTPDNRCGIDMIGDYDINNPFYAMFGDPYADTSGSFCQPREMLCRYFGPLNMEEEIIAPETCDGEPLEVPQECTMFPDFPYF
jgi:hypothetical protein